VWKQNFTKEKIDALMADYDLCVDLRSYVRKTKFRMEADQAVAAGLYDPAAKDQTFYDPATNTARINYHRIMREITCSKMAAIVLGPSPSATSLQNAQRCTLDEIYTAQKKYRDGRPQDQDPEWQQPNGILYKAWAETFGQKICPFVERCFEKGFVSKDTPHGDTCVFNKFMTKEEFAKTASKRDELKAVGRIIASVLAVESAKKRARHTADDIIQGLGNVNMSDESMEAAIEARARALEEPEKAVVSDSEDEEHAGDRKPTDLRRRKNVSLRQEQTALLAEEQRTRGYPTMRAQQSAKPSGRGGLSSGRGGLSSGRGGQPSGRGQSSGK
jgi:hypothetical protein